MGSEESDGNQVAKNRSRGVRVSHSKRISHPERG